MKNDILWCKYSNPLCLPYIFMQNKSSVWQNVFQLKMISLSRNHQNYNRILQMEISAHFLQLSGPLAQVYILCPH